MFSKISKNVLIFTEKTYSCSFVKTMMYQNNNELTKLFAYYNMS